MDEQEAIAIKKLGVKYEPWLDVIRKDADVQMYWPSFAKLYNQLIEGIYLNKGTMKYKFDMKTNSNWYFIYAKAFYIAWIEDSRYWRWTTIKEHCETMNVAELINVCWFDIQVKLNANLLSPRVAYEVIWKIKLNNGAQGWHAPVIMELKKPNGYKIERKQCLDRMPRGEWFEISIGDFSVDNDGCENGGEIEVSMSELGGHWKRGFLLKGVEVRPRRSYCT